MPVRLPDCYAEDQMLPGYPVDDSGKVVEAPSFFEGDDAVLGFYMSYNGIPVDPAVYDIEVILKKNRAACHILWRGTLNDGLFRDGNAGMYKIWINSETTSRLLPGLYYVDVKIKEKTGSPLKEFVIMSFQINIARATTSPCTTCECAPRHEVVYCNENGVWTKKEKHPETTVPCALDTTRY